MSNGLNQGELEMLLERLCFEGLDEESCAQLEAIIASDSSAQRRYVEAVHFREGLAYLLSDERASDAPAELRAGETESSLAERLRGDGIAGADSQPPLRSSKTPWDRLRHWLPSWALAASVAFVVGAAVAIVASPDSMRDIAWNSEDARRVQPTISAPMPFLQESQLGKISGLSLEASTDGLLRSMQVGQELRCGEVVQLSAGFIRVRLHAGPELVIAGPAEFSLVGERSVFVRVGRLTASAGQRLTLQTPLVTAECVDAEASLDARDDDSASIYVHEGIVSLLTTPHESAASEKLQTLRAREGLLVEPKAGAALLSTAATGPLPGVVRDWDEVEAALSPYQQLVLSDRPMAYWPLHEVQRHRRALDLSQNGFDGKAIGNWPAEPPEGASGDGRGVYFNGESYVEPDRKPPVNLLTGFTIESWAKVVGGPAFQSIFTSRWVRGSHTPQQQCFGFTLYAGDNDRWQFWTGNGRHGESWDELISPVAVDRTQWTHVVASFIPDGRESGGAIEGKVRLYVNGELAIEGRHWASLVDFEWPARIGSAEFVPRYLTSWLFKGFISDVALYGYPLEPAKIKEHHDVGKPTVNLETSSHWLTGESLLASTERRWAP